MICIVSITGHMTNDKLLLSQKRPIDYNLKILFFCINTQYHHMSNIWANHERLDTLICSMKLIKGQIRVTNGVSCDFARITKSMEKLYLRGQF
ncbi:TPA: hypothetical protein I7679_04165 [Vibrio vulnificus]|nr:hypothetical protein [Vibrio vulnificus]